MSNLLYRYLFPNWLFKDADKGTLWERAAAAKHNEAQGPHLLTYTRRWAILSLIFYGLGYIIILPFITSFLLTVSVCMFAIAITLLSIWLRLVVK